MPWILLKKSIDRRFFYVVEAEHNMPLVTSEMYDSRQGALDGIKALRRVTRRATLLDVTA
ncbi:DUF1508 domain-containing protein [Tsukamurella sp. 1534]|uniref:DUF1508 domain-containing protein n=1 Tax=Tsukamurella sp. 1534 TaxID=1151061 RepID=UPI00059414EF|nr:DUF1508 domain-containing protein [Tsukamurella sp. 1534]